jgi:hypothetical protein
MELEDQNKLFDNNVPSRTHVADVKEQVSHCKPAWASFLQHLNEDLLRLQHGPISLTFLGKV